MSNATNQRVFKGPFLILGMLPSWPEELEARKDFVGPHTSLSALFPIKAFPTVDGDVVKRVTGSNARPPEGPVYPSDYGKKIAGRVAQRVIPSKRRWAERVEEYARRAGDENLQLLVSALDKPRTINQIARKLHLSRPTVEYFLRALQKEIGGELKIAEGRGKRGRPARVFSVQGHAQ